MQTTISRCRPAAIVISVAVILCLPPACLAQPEEQSRPQLLRIAVIQVKPDMRDEMRDVMKQASDAYRKAGVPFRGVWQTAAFGDTFEYVVSTPIEKFAQYDGDGPLQKVMSAEERIRFIQRRRRCLSGRQAYAVRTRPDLSIVKENQGPPGLAVITSLTVAPGKQLEFENFLKSEILPAFKKLDVDGFWAHQTIFGGETSRWVFVGLIKNFAELDKGPWLIRALGQEDAGKVTDKAAGLIASFEQSISRYVPELSYQLQ